MISRSSITVLPLATSATSSPATSFLYAGDFLAGEYDNSGNILNRYVPGPAADEPVAWYSGPGTTNRHWPRQDAQGSIIGWSDATNTSQMIVGYDAYGEPSNAWSWGERYAYTGQVAIPEAQLYFYKARVYDPGIGRFLQTDPTGYAVGGINLYAYAGNDPVNGSDPSGLDAGGVSEEQCIEGCAPPTSDRNSNSSSGGYGIYDPNLDQVTTIPCCCVPATFHSAGDIPLIQILPISASGGSQVNAGGSSQSAPQSTQVAEVVVTGHRYHTDNQVCAMALSASQQGELLRRFAVPGYEGERLDNGVYYAHTGALPGGFVTTQFSNGYRSVTNTTTQFHVFVYASGVGRPRPIPFRRNA